ncbi:hypothetical protein NPIL_544921 [Nephila pilipes]|uniref:Uncharacterized protein n=1 Tax=Nephila pilipes TaxID=299642 RepID=A0A8X6Q251_NEPPI|nr:hypothetical protein NPIL_544921 [Nephila pilipes]
MIAKIRSQAIWMPWGKAGIRPPALTTNIGILNLQVKSSFIEIIRAADHHKYIGLFCNAASSVVTEAKYTPESYESITIRLRSTSGCFVQIDIPINVGLQIYGRGCKENCREKFKA